MKAPVLVLSCNGEISGGPGSSSSGVLGPTLKSPASVHRQHWPPSTPPPVALALSRHPPPALACCRVHLRRRLSSVAQAHVNSLLYQRRLLQRWHKDNAARAPASPGAVVAPSSKQQPGSSPSNCSRALLMPGRREAALMPMGTGCEASGMLGATEAVACSTDCKALLAARKARLAAAGAKSVRTPLSSPLPALALQHQSVMPRCCS